MAFKNTRNAKKGLVPNYCEIPECSFTAMVTRHRIKPGRRGGKYIAGNVIGLCPNCHVLAEQGFYSQAYLFNLVHNRLRDQNSSVDINGYTQVSRTG